MKLTKNGQSTLLFVSVLSAIGVIFVLNSADIQKKNLDFKARDYDQILLNEMTTSAFSIMESALARRLWEPPPDSSCLKAETFSVNGTLEEGMSWRVNGKYNYKTKNFEMLAEGTYKNLTAKYIKRVKVLDVSDYLLFSDSTSSLSLRRLYNPKVPTALIARDRRVYTKGPVILGGNIPRPNPMMDWNGSPASWPGEFGTIIQGDRIQFGGGLQYSQYNIQKPNPSSSNVEALLEPYAQELGGPASYYGQFGGGSAVITKDFNKAMTLKQQVLDATPGPLTLASVKNEIYPIALFKRNLPLESWKATDNGQYFNDVDRYSIFNYGWGKANNFGIRIDVTCLSPVSAFVDKNFCSNSEHFPKGFEAWRQDADLEGTLFTSDAEEIPSPKMSWDNMEALEEDARQCGRVIESPTNAYVDCPIWDVNYIKRYVAGDSTCEQVSSINIDSITLNNFSAAQLTNPNLTDRLLRRVIYTKVPIEIKQSAAQGLMMGTIPSAAARKNFALWVVSEDMMALKGYQQDTTSPLDSEPERLREIRFNSDATGGTTEPLPMVLLSPERIHLLSPQYVPATLSYLTQYWPIVGGRIQPVIHNFTDYVRQENDGFRYGYRSYRIDNVSLISNSNVSASSPFVLRGLWSGPDSSADQSISNMCMVSKAGFTLQKVPSTTSPGDFISLRTTAQIPSYISDPNSPIPPLTSQYYNGDTTQFPTLYYPSIFWLQRANGHAGREESDIVYSGIRMYTRFDNFTPAGKRNLSSPIYGPADSRNNYGAPITLEHKNYMWDDSFYYADVPPGTACIPSNVSSRESSYTISGVAPTQPSVNNGRYILIHVDPPADYRNLGAIIGVDQPVLETQN